MKINLGTIAGLEQNLENSDITSIPLNIEIGNLNSHYILPKPGRNIARLIPQESLTQSFDVNEPNVVNVQAELLIGDKKLGFGFENIGAEDTLSVIQVAPDRFVADISHSQPVKECRAICPDGTEGHPCVDCTIGGITVRICC